METSKLILGTVQFGLDYGINNVSGKPELKTVFSIFDSAFQNNICVLDTAEAYGDAHEVIGKYHASSLNRFQVITRFNAAKTGASPDFIIRVQTHLRQLGVSSLYAYMFHSAEDFYTHFSAHEKEIAKLRRSGLISRFGVSVYTNQELEMVIESGKVDLIQLPFNLLDNLNLRGSLLKRAKAKGIEIHARSVFLQGLFFRDPVTLPGKLAGLRPYLLQLRDLANANGMDMNKLALSYVMQQDLIDKVVIGVDNVEHLKSNLALLDESSSPVMVSNDIMVREKALLNPARWTSGKVLAITQARMGSTRLPGKVLRKAGDFTVLELHLRRLFKSELIDQFIVATTSEGRDEQIEIFCKKHDIKSFRGSDADVLDRYYKAAVSEKPEWVVRVTSDCPLIDAKVVDAVIRKAITSDADYCSNTLKRTFPDGVDVEVMKFTALEAAWREAKLQAEREHVTPFIYNNSTFNGEPRFTSANYQAEIDLSNVRITVDTAQDLEVVNRLVSELGADREYLEYAKHYLSDPVFFLMNAEKKTP